MVELLAAGLTGGQLSIDALEAAPTDMGQTGGPTSNGELILALDPARFRGGTAHAEKVFECIVAQEGARLPSSRRFERGSALQRKESKCLSPFTMRLWRSRIDKPSCNGQ